MPTVVGSAPILRPRRPGDTFMPLGWVGTAQKVNEFMINEKIPAAWRNRIPLFVSCRPNLMGLWLYRLDEHARFAQPPSDSSPQIRTTLKL